MPAELILLEPTGIAAGVVGLGGLYALATRLMNGNRQGMLYHFLK